MISQNSIDAYREIRESGVLSTRRLEVWEALVRIYLQEGFQPWSQQPTGSEVFKWVPARGLSQSNVLTRLGELRDMGMAEECETRVCSVTGKRALTWKPIFCTAPRKLEKKNRSKASLERELEELRGWAKNARIVIESGVALMPLSRLSEWKGHRMVLETYPGGKS